MVRKHLIPRFGDLTLEQITLREVMDWLREMRDAKTLSPQTQRHCLATLSRFWGWCVLWNHTTLPNPCRSVPTAIKPVVVHAKRATLEDESKLAELIAALPDPVNIMLALANRTGLRLGEVCGLRLSDLDTIPKGFLTVSHSYANPLKEDRRGVGKVKKAPAPVDVAEALKMHVARRRLQGGGPDDSLFVPTKTSKRPRANDWRGFKKENIRDLWWAACKTAKLVDDEGKPTVTLVRLDPHDAGHARRESRRSDRADQQVPRARLDRDHRKALRPISARGLPPGAAASDAAAPGAEEEEGRLTPREIRRAEPEQVTQS